MPRLLVPLPPRSMLPVEAKPDVGEDRLPLVVSIRTPMPLSVLVLEMDPLLMTELLELMVTAGGRGRRDADAGPRHRW